jgi:hypothetical protein
MVSLFDFLPGKKIAEKKPATESTSNKKKEKEMKKEPDHYSIAGLKMRGWTKSMVDKIAGEPDMIVPNPHYKSAAPMKLYSHDRIHAIEETDDFKDLLEKSIKRREAARKAANTRKKNLLGDVESLVVNVPVIDGIIEKAIESYNRHGNLIALDLADRGMEYWPDEATTDSSDGFLHRITVNYLRHECTVYDKKLGEIKGKTGIGIAYIRLKRKVLENISKIYPWLSVECERQVRSIDRDK